MHKQIKLISFQLLGALFFLATGCGNPDPVMDEDHQEAVELTEAMRLSHDGMKERLEFLRMVNHDFKKRVKTQEVPDATLAPIVDTQDSLIAVFEKMCHQQKKLIDENEDFLKKHERKSLDAARIDEQHRRIRENYETLQLQAAAIVQEVENIKIRVDGAALRQGPQ